MLTALADPNCYAYKKCLKLDRDETKRQATQRTRGLDFADAGQIERDAAIVFDDGRRDCGERRRDCLGLLHDQPVVAACTFRGDALRVISMRRASRREWRIYVQYRTSSAD